MQPKRACVARATVTRHVWGKGALSLPARLPGGMQYRMVSRILSSALTAASFGMLAGCTSISTYYSENAMKPTSPAAATTLYACSGYSCVYKTKVNLGAPDVQHLSDLMAAGAASPEAERAAVSNAVMYFEEKTMRATGVKDLPRSVLGDSGKKGQMDCIDESTNTRTLLLYMADTGMLKHHKVERNVSRGFLVDGRYPHSTAVMRDPGGKKWAVDSWYGIQGEAPDVMPLSEWLPRGFLSSGEVEERPASAAAPAAALSPVATAVPVAPKA
jgi:hypothetical protein